MDTATLSLGYLVLRHGSVRVVARRVGRAPASVADALRRIEASLAIPLMHRVAGRLASSVGAERVMRALDAMAGSLRGIAALSGSIVADDNSWPWLARHPLGMEALNRFIHVVRVGSIRRGAQALAMGQPQLTRQIKRLERMIGGPLLTRGQDGSDVTILGRRFHEHAAALDAAWRDLCEPSRSHATRELRTVRFGVMVPFGHESWVATSLAQLIARWDSAETRQHLYVSSMTAGELIDRLKAGQIDVGFVDIDLRRMGIEQKIRETSELVMIAPRGAGLSGNAEELLACHDIAVPSRKSGLREALAATSDLSRAIDNRPRSHLVEINSIPVIINLVLRHGFVSFLPLKAAEALRGRVDILRLASKPVVPFVLAWQRTEIARSAAVRIDRLLVSAKG